MEYRIALTKQEAFELSSKLKILGTNFVKNEYTGTKRIRTNKNDRFEIEFEGEVPEEIKDRENVRGWEILR